MAKPATSTATAGTPKAAQPPRVAPIVTAATNGVPMPDRNQNRGSKTSYPFDTLTEIGMSFGVKNKTAKQLASIISNQNRKPGPIKKDANGATVYKTQNLTAQDGTVTSVPTAEPETLPGKQYFAFDIADPKKDPDQANVRVFRQK